MFTQRTEAKAGFLLVCLTLEPGLSLKCESSGALAHVSHPMGSTPQALAADSLRPVQF